MLTLKPRQYMCPVCGARALGFPAAFGDFSFSGDSCLACGFEFGYHDADRRQSYRTWRRAWINEGMPWRQGSAPHDWNAAAGLHDLLEGTRIVGPVCLTANDEAVLLDWLEGCAPVPGLSDSVPDLRKGVPRCVLASLTDEACEAYVASLKCDEAPDLKQSRRTILLALLGADATPVPPAG